MADAEFPDEPLLLACTQHVDEPARATVPFAAVATAVEVVADGKSIARGR